MNFKPKFANYKFNKISVDNFIEKYRINNPKASLKELRNDILYFRQLKYRIIYAVVGVLT